MQVFKKNENNRGWKYITLYTVLKFPFLYILFQMEQLLGTMTPVWKAVTKSVFVIGRNCLLDWTPIPARGLMMWTRNPEYPDLGLNWTTMVIIIEYVIYISSKYSNLLHCINNSFIWKLNFAAKVKKKNWMSIYWNSWLSENKCSGHLKMKIECA